MSKKTQSPKGEFWLQHAEKVREYGGGDDSTVKSMT